MCSAISKSSPSNCQPKSHEVRYKWAVLDIGRNSVRPWTRARTITCNRGIRSRFPNSRVLCQVRRSQSELRSDAQGGAFLENRRGAGNLARSRLSGGSWAMIEPLWSAEGRLKAGCRQDWLPHKAAPIFIIRCDAAGVISNLCHREQPMGRFAQTPAGICRYHREVRPLTICGLAMLCCQVYGDTQSGPQPPCGMDSIPPAPSPADSPTVKFWRLAELGEHWRPPVCTGWTGEGFSTLVTTAARFRYAGDMADMLLRSGAISSLVGMRY